jgi:hypothetical protein
MSKAAILCAGLFALSAISLAEGGGELSESEHGTCAIAIVTRQDMAVIVDSKLTRLSQSDQACKVAGKQGCKAVLIRKDVLLVVTGVFNDPVNGRDWEVTAETKKLLTDLPTPMTLDAIKDFTQKWFWVLVNHYRGKPSLNLDSGRAVSTLMIGTRIGGEPFLAKIEIRLNSEGKFQFVGWTPQLEDWPQNYYAGSCLDYVGTNDLGVHRFAADPPDPNLQSELNDLGYQKASARSVDELIPLMKSYEELFEQIGVSKNQCWIGPPYDVATWAEGADGWTVNFKTKCKGTTARVPHSSRTPR